MGIRDQFDFSIDVPCSDIKVDATDVESGAKEVLKVIKKSWDVDKVSFETCGIGYVNITLIAKQEGCDEKVVFRVFTENPFAELMDKKQERVVTLLLNELDISPNILCMFENGFCFEFVEGKLFHWKDLDEFDDIRISKCAVREFAKLHSLKTRDLAVEKYNVDLNVDFLNGHMGRLLAMYPDEARVDALAEGEVKEMMRKSAPLKSAIIAEMDEMKKMVQDMNLPLVMCHHDGNPTNIIYDSQNDRGALVDFDLTCFGYAEFDIAIFLQSIALGFKMAQASSNRRRADFWLEVLLEYLQAKAKIEGVEDPEKRALEQLDGLYVKVRKMALVFTLIFFIYCVNIATTMDNPPFLHPIDYIRVGLEEYEEFYLKPKKEVTELDLSPQKSSCGYV